MMKNMILNRAAQRGGGSFIGNSWLVRLFCLVALFGGVLLSQAATPPTISALNDQFANEDTPLSGVAFTVNDVETPAANLTLSATSTNLALVPISGITFGGAGTDRTLTITPAKDQFGTTVIQVTVLDGEGLTASTSFLLKVFGSNDPPSIILSTKAVSTAQNSTVQVGFTVNDPDGLTGLIVSGSSSNPTLISATGLFFGGSDANRTLIMIPASGQTGSATITITVTDSGGANASDTIVLTVTTPPPSITVQPETQTVTVGATATLSVAASGGVPLNYQWKFNGIDISGATSAQLILNNVTANQSGSYTVVVSNLAGAVTSAEAVLSVILPPVITKQPESQTVFYGASVLFTVDATGTLPLGYQWRFNGTNIDGANSPFYELSLYTTNAIPLTNKAGIYNVVINNGAGSVTSADAVLTIVPPLNLPPIVNISSPGNGTKFISPKNIKIVADPADLDGNIVRVDFFQGANLLGSATSSPYSIVFSNVAVGSFTLTAIATDNRGGTGTSSPINITGVLDLGSQPGQVDGSFNPLTGANGPVSSVAIQADGKVLIGGGFSAVNEALRSRIARLNSDGSLDATFNPGSGANNAVSSIAVQADGKILIGGAFSDVNGSARGRIARLNGDGSLDASFNSGSGANDSVNAIAVQADGKIIIVGSFTNVNNVARSGIARLNADGSSDATFDPGTGIGGGFVTRVNAVAIQSDGKILLGGDFADVNGTSRIRIARLNANGSLDAGFNPGTGANDAVNAIVVQADGKILISGSFANVNGVSRNAIARLNADGSLDATFNPGIGANNSVVSIAVQPNGKIVIVGAFANYNGVSRSGVARLNSDGSLDTAFDPGTGISGGFVARVNTVALQSNGRIVIGGDFSTVNGVNLGNIARLNGDPNLNPVAVKFAAISVIPGNQIQLTINGEAGKTYVIQASADLSTWTSIQTNTPTSAVSTFTDTSASIFTRRFYRAVSPP